MNLTIEYLKDLIKDLEYARTEDEAICYSQIIEVSLPGLKAVLTAMIEQKAREDRGAERQAHEIVMGQSIRPAMSRRDMFAMAALPECQRARVSSMEDDCSYAVRYADALIAELDKGKR